MLWRDHLSARLLPFIVAIAILCDASTAKSQESKCTLSGIVLDAESGKPIADASVQIEKLRRGVATDTSGSFIMSDLAAGSYSIKLSHVGYETQTLNISIRDSINALLTAKLVPRAVDVGAIEVTSSQTYGSDESVAAHQSVDQSILSNVPEFGDDSFRAAARLPGLTSCDYSARFTVRGGEFDEVLVVFDGMRLNEPFHLKDLDGGALSIVDGAVVEKIDVYTGGFPARYGDKMSAVFDMRTRPVEPNRRRVHAGVSLLAAGVLAEGTFSRAKGSWLVSARRGYLEHITGIARETKEISPKYYDLFAKVRYELSKSIALSFHTLYSGDHLEFRGEDVNPGDTLSGLYNNLYTWATVSIKPSPRLSVQTVFSSGHLGHDRTASIGDDLVLNTSYDATNVRGLDFFGSKTDADLIFRDWFHMKSGLELQWSHADYNYQDRDYHYGYYITPDRIEIRLIGIDSAGAAFDKSGVRMGTHLSGRFDIGGGTQADVGVRWDQTSYSGDNLLSPRVSLTCPAIGKTTLRAAWGYYYQCEAMDQILVEYGEREFHPAQKAEHYTLSLERRFNNGVMVRAEGYRKRYSHLRPAVRKITNTLIFLPELDGETVLVFPLERESRGLELTVAKATGGRLSWWFSYGYSRVFEKEERVYFLSAGYSAYRGAELPGPQDQRHTVRLDMQYRPTDRWLISSAFQIHTGWPYTDLRITSGGQVHDDSLWQTRFPVFERLDLRVSRLFPVGNGKITAYIELLNALNRKNVRFYTWDIYNSGGQHVVVKDPECWLGRVPSIGISYEVEY